MKISKTMLVVLGTGIFVIVAAVVGTGSLRRVGEKRQLEQELAASQTRLQSIRLEPISAQQADIERRLTDATPQLEFVKAELSQNVTSPAAATALFSAAAANRLTVDMLNSTEPADESVVGVGLAAISVTASLAGKSSDMIGFVRDLNNLLRTGAIKSFEMTVPATSGNVTARNGDNATAKVELTVYRYEGDK